MPMDQWKAEDIQPGAGLFTYILKAGGAELYTIAYLNEHGFTKKGFKR